MIPVRCFIVGILLDLCLCHRQTLVDLSYGYVSGKVPTFPGITTFRYTRLVQADVRGIPYQLHDFETSEHVGTHMDAPSHFNFTARTLDQIPLERLFITAILVDVSEETGNNYNYTLPVEKILAWERNHGPIPSPCVIVFNFGWHRFYSNPDLYIGTGGEVNSPGLSQEVAEYLANTRKVYGVGLDTISVDQDSYGRAHKVFADNDMYIIENLNLSYPLPLKFQMIALPMKLVEGTGAPVRVVALVKQPC